MSKVYIHYGHSSFDAKLFRDVSDNQEDLCSGRKPHSGLWGTDIESKHGWKELILSDNEVKEKESWRLLKRFKFTLKESANIMYIRNLEDFVETLQPYIRNFHKDFNSIPVCNYVVDWRKLANDYDAIETNTGNDEELKSILYGWECDSICVFHKDVIVLL